MKRLYEIIFKITLKLFPSYLYSKSLNKIKNYFAKRCLQVDGEVNWGKKISISKDVKIGMHSGVGDSAFVQGPTVIGNDVMMGRNVTIFRRNHRTSRIDIPMAQQGMEEAKELIIEDDVWIGDGVTILPSVKRIGTGSILGTQTVVTKDVPPYSVIVGNPGRIVKNRKESDASEKKRIVGQNK